MRLEKQRTLVCSFKQVMLQCLNFSYNEQCKKKSDKAFSFKELSVYQNLSDTLPVFKEKVSLSGGDSECCRGSGEPEIRVRTMH